VIRRWAVLALGSACLAVVACGSEATAGPPRVGDPLPDFAAPRLEGTGEGPAGGGPAGDTVRLAAAGGRATLVNLWATWCAPCRAEMPYLESVGQAYAPGGLRILGVSTDHRGAVEQVRGVVAERGVTYDILLDPEARSTDLFGVYGLPATFLADTEGVITWMRLGPIEEGDRDFEAALAEVAPRAVAPDAGGAPTEAGR